MPTGAKCKIPFLMCFGGTGKKAWRCISTITSKELSTVDGKLSFSIEMGGDIEKGTYDIQGGVPTFTAAVESNVWTARQFENPVIDDVEELREE